MLTPKLISEASVRQALENGTRIALLNKTDCKIIERSIDIDYKKTASVSRRLADLFFYWPDHSYYLYGGHGRYTEHFRLKRRG